MFPTHTRVFKHITCTLSQEWIFHLKMRLVGNSQTLVALMPVYLRFIRLMHFYVSLHIFYYEIHKVIQMVNPNPNPNCIETIRNYPTSDLICTYLTPLSPFSHKLTQLSLQLSPFSPQLTYTYPQLSPFSSHFIPLT